MMMQRTHFFLRLILYRHIRIFQKSISANSGAIWCLAANENDSQIAVSTEDQIKVYFYR